MAVNVYRWDDTSAPVISGTQGTLITVLDACLVNGYGAKVGAGWTKEFTGTNRAAYRKGGAGNAYYVVDDDNVANQSIYPGENATIRGYMTMTDIDTGTNQFPTSATALRSIIKKSAVVDAAARNWVLIEENGFVHLCIDIYPITSGTRVTFICFGKFISNINLDEYNFMLVAGDTDDANYAQTDWTLAPTRIILARSYNQVDESQKCSLSFTQYNGSVSVNGLNGFSEADNTINLSEYKLYEINSTSGKHLMRGKIPGLFFPFEYRTLQSTAPVFDTFSSADTTVSYIQLKTSSTTVTSGAPIVQTNLTWY